VGGQRGGAGAGHDERGDELGQGAAAEMANLRHELRSFGYGKHDPSDR
jgi:hypothetical protein